MGKCFFAVVYDHYLTPLIDTGGATLLAPLNAECSFLLQNSHLRLLVRAPIQGLRLWPRPERRCPDESRLPLVVVSHPRSRTGGSLLLVSTVA